MRLEGYTCSHEDPCLYTRMAADNSLIVLILYVDDMLIARKSVANVDALKHRLHETFAMKYLGGPDTFWACGSLMIALVGYSF